MIKDVLNLKGVTVLNKKQQRYVQGGGTGTCGYTRMMIEVYFNEEVGHFTTRIVEDRAYGVDMQTARRRAGEGINGRWCCDSCATASWGQIFDI